MTPHGYNDPMLKKLHDTIRSLRQAQRHALQTFRTYDEAEAALDSLACDGLIETTARHRIVRQASSFAVILHNQ